MVSVNDQNPPEGPQGGDASDAVLSQFDNPSAEDYTSTGKTLVRTRRGHKVVPSDASLPVVDSKGVKMSADNARAVVDEFPDYAYIDENGGE